MKRTILVLLPLFLLFPIFSLVAQEAAEEGKPGEEGQTRLKASTFSGLALRGIGPALMSGRISDIAVHPGHKSTWYVAVASGGVWKTTNRGTTWIPIFDNQGAYSIGCVAVDPNNPLVVWVGTGENNSQRSVGYGDGVYKSLDGGKTWKNMGLKNSEHIGKILIDPRDSQVVFVAVQGPLWAPGGDRGLYKSTDGGKSWSAVLTISENTGVTDVLFDPRNPDLLYAAAYQRRRHVWTLINGGPEAAIYKSLDGGATWTKLAGGLPAGDLGRIGLAISPIDPHVVYALIEAEGDAGGFYRSADQGESWEKRSSYGSGSPQYYQEIFADPHAFDRLYSMDTPLMVTDDGGKTWNNVEGKYKHVDNHALAFDPQDPEYLLIGCDGGLYESFDRTKTWNFKANLPVTQFYKLCVDNDFPFYNVYGGTQDNNTQGGPSRTRSAQGITNSDWFITVGGDGFKPQVDPEDPNIVYSQYQYGGLRRYDKKSGALINIQPQPGRDDPPLRWNWDSPLLISPHSRTRLYFAANRLYRSEDRGNSWEAVSPDLTRQIDRNKLKVMGKIWSVDAVSKNASTSFYGNIVSLAESPLREGIIYAGTDDGLIQVTEDGGKTWRRIESFPGIPEMTYVADIEPSLHHVDTVFAVFNDHKMGDFKPYVLKSTDRGQTWTSITGDLPERGPAWALAEDHGNENLLFVGTEFSLFFTIDGGEHWIQLKGGVPAIAFRDLEIQRRENDLACATFGRGFYILDDYTPLRLVSTELLEKESFLFPVKKALLYTLSHRLGWSEKASQGDAFFSAPNPPFGAIFTYYLKEELKTRKKLRQEGEKKTEKEGGEISYPSWEELRAEDREEPPAIILTVTDEWGNVIQRISGSTQGGFHRVAWDLCYPAFGAWGSGPMVVPGIYTVRMEKRVDGKLFPLADPQTFEVAALDLGTLPPPDRAKLLVFLKKAGDLQRAVLGAIGAAGETDTRLQQILAALHDAPNAGSHLAEKARELAVRLKDIQVELTGDTTLERRNAPAPPSIQDRMYRALSGHWTALPTGTQREAYELAADAFEKVLADLRDLVERDLKKLEDEMEAAGARWTPGRVPRWKRE